MKPHSGEVWTVVRMSTLAVAVPAVTVKVTS